MTQRIEYHTNDKSKWPKGAWIDEPDKVSWTDEETGLPCLIVRGRSGALCGYVGVSPGPPHYLADYDNVPVEVHGGLTYAEQCSHGDQATSICHIPVEGQPDNVYWLGFDCAHSGDCMPARYGISAWETYRDIQYVEREVLSLAKQLKALEAISAGAASQPEGAI